MNENIKRLAEQADDTTNFSSERYIVDINPLFIEEFARLIVNECMMIYQAIDNGNKQEGTYDYLLALQRRFKS